MSDKLTVARRWGTAPSERPGCSEASNCPDVFELEDGNFAFIGEDMGDGTIRVPREVLLAAAREILGTTGGET